MTKSAAPKFKQRVIATAVTLDVAIYLAGRHRNCFWRLVDVAPERYEVFRYVRRRWYHRFTEAVFARGEIAPGRE
jgi:hypothetical protein